MVNAIARGLTNESLLADLLASAEYYNSSSKGHSSTADWVISAFLHALNRVPTDAELEAWDGALQ